MARKYELKPEKLIAAVRENGALYDPAQKKYGDLEVKAKLWSAIAEKCGLRTGQEAKMIWKNLRDCYRIYRNKSRYKPNAKKWKYYQQMNFLAPYIKKRKFQPHDAAPPASLVMGIADAESGENVDLDKSIHINESQGEFTTIQYWTDTQAKFDTQDHDEPLQCPQMEEASLESAMDSEHESFEDILPEALNNEPADNSLKMFFDAMYASTWQLPPSLQRIVKKKIFEAVIEGEENADLLRASPTSSVQIKTEP